MKCRNRGVWVLTWRQKTAARRRYGVCAVERIHGLELRQRWRSVTTYVRPPTSLANAIDRDFSFAHVTWMSITCLANCHRPATLATVPSAAAAAAAAGTIYRHATIQALPPPLLLLLLLIPYGSTLHVWVYSPAFADGRRGMKSIMKQHIITTLCSRLPHILVSLGNCQSTDSILAYLPDLVAIWFLH